jgi:hypothetical protein
LLNQAPLDRTVIIKNKETREISGLKVGIIEKLDNSVEIKTFFAEVNNEILMGELKGDVQYTDYLEATFDEILSSIKKK